MTASPSPIAPRATIATASRHTAKRHGRCCTVDSARLEERNTRRCHPGLAEAQTVNGSIEVRMGRANWTDALEFETVNGGITIELPGDLNADVNASTVNGSLSSDWPLTVSLSPITLGSPPSWLCQ